MSAAAEQSHATGTSVLDQVGDNIIHHVSNSSLEHPLIHLPHIFGIDISVTKHVLMLWVVAILVSCAVIIPVRKYLQKDKAMMPWKISRISCLRGAGFGWTRSWFMF